MKPRQLSRPLQHRLQWQRQLLMLLPRLPLTNLLKRLQLKRRPKLPVLSKLR